MAVPRNRQSRQPSRWAVWLQTSLQRDNYIRSNEPDWNNSTWCMNSQIYSSRNWNEQTVTEDRSALRTRVPCCIRGNNRCVGEAKSIKCVLYISAIDINYFPTELLIGGGVDFLWCFAVLRIIYWGLLSAGEVAVPLSDAQHSVCSSQARAGFTTLAWGQPPELEIKLRHLSSPSVLCNRS